MPPNLDQAACLVTGAASGIGRDFVCMMAQQYAHVKFTLVDVDERGCQETVAHAQQRAGRTIATEIVSCDVSNPEQQQRAFARHIARYGTLDIAFLNAGIMERGDLIASTTTDYLTTLNVNLSAVVVGCNLAARAMARNANGGVLLLTASAGGLFPMPHGPVYAAAKAGVVNLARSLAPRLASRGIAVHALCPQYADTPLVRTSMAQSALMREFVERDTAGHILQVDEVSRAALWLLRRPLKESPVVLFIAGRNGAWYSWPSMKVVGKTAAPPRRPVGPLAEAWRAWATGALPNTYQRVELHTLSTDFAAATRLVPVPLPTTLPEGHVLIRRTYAGVNASDINFSAGRYFTGTQQQLPCPAGFEAIGVVAAVATGSVHGIGLAPGDPVATMVYGGFAEFAIVPARQVLPVDAPTPQTLALLVSGLTASIALETCGGALGPGSTVMVTAAAGGTGQFAVQLAKQTGATVIATCSSDDKAAMLRTLGADRIINYKTEDVRAVLKQEFPKGLDCVYESVGGSMFTTCVGALATGGRCIIIGMMEEYSGEWKPSVHPGLAEKLLWKSATVSGFFLLNHTRLFRKHLDKLQALMRKGTLRVAVDPRRFVGLASVPEAVQYLHSGRSTGKVVVQVAAQLPAGEQDPRGRL